MSFDEDWQRSCSHLLPCKEVMYSVLDNVTIVLSFFQKEKELFIWKHYVIVWGALYVITKEKGGNIEKKGELHERTVQHDHFKTNCYNILRG